MNELTPLPSYAELTEALQNTNSPLSAAEVHGIICGIICAASGKTEPRWEKLVVGDKKNKHSLELIHQLFTISFQQMSEFSFEFKMILLDDNSPISDRAEALGFWCQGFLIGLKQAKIPVEQRASAEVTEALNDIVEIAQVKCDEVTTNDEDELAYFELVEYIRLVVLMIYHELKATDRPSGLNHDLLH